MKNIIAAGVMVAMLGLYSCDEGNYSMFSNDGGATTIRTNDETGNLRLQAKGNITFTDDETMVKSISGNGFIRFKKNGNKVVVETNSAGEIIYTINDGVPRKTPDETDKKVIARAIKEMINVGFDAKNRVRRIYDKGGSNAVLTAIDDLKNDYVKSSYFEYLITETKLTGDEMANVARKIGEDIGSDFEKANVLKKISASYLNNEQTTDAYLQAINTISSDFEKANALKVIIDQPLTPAQYTQVVNITGNINSDFEKAGVLKQLVSHGIPGESNMNTFLETTRNIGSDFEQANVLKEVIKQGLPAGSSFNKFLDVTGDIGSDFEKANVFKELAKANITQEDNWISLIKETEKISSDNDKSNVMIEIAKRMPKSEKLTDAYMLSAKTISSDFDYGNAVKAVK